MKKTIHSGLVLTFFCAFFAVCAIPAFSITKAQSEELLKLAQNNSGFFETDFSGNYTVVQEKPGEGKSITEAVLYRRDKMQNGQS